MRVRYNTDIKIVMIGKRAHLEPLGARYNTDIKVIEKVCSFGAHEGKIKYRYQND